MVREVCENCMDELEMREKKSEEDLNMLKNLNYISLRALYSP